MSLFEQNNPWVKLMARIPILKPCTGWFFLCCVLSTVSGGGLLAQETANEIIERREARQDDTSSSGISGTAPAAQRALENRQAVINSLAMELNELIPGDYKESSPEREELQKVASHFVDGNSDAINYRLDQMRKSNPDLPPSELLLAGLYYAVNNPNQGHALLEQASINNPMHPAISIALGRLAFSQSRIADALALVEKAERQLQSMELSSQAKLHYQTQIADSNTLIAIRQNRIEDAERYASTWEQLQPASPKMLLARAELKFLQNDIPGSIDYLSKLQKALPESRPPETIIASWYQRQQDEPNTEKWIRLAFEKYPDNPSVQLEYGNWAISQEDFTTAVAAIKSYEAAEGESMTTKMMKARMAFARQSYGEAEQLLADLFKSQPNSFDVSNLYALSLIESDNTEKQQLAKQITQRNLQALPSNQVANAAAGWVMLRLGNKEAATEILTRTARSSELSPEVAFFVASMLQGNGKMIQAKLLLQPALESKGMFLYRERANALMKSLGGASDLPSPAGN
jgi:predicted Zn-dependent protease